VVPPAGKRWRVQSIFAILTCNATVANRSIRLDVNSGAFWFEVQHSAFQIASEVARYVWAPGLPQTRTGVTPTIEYLQPLPIGLEVDNVFSIGTDATNFQAGDTWTSIGLLVEEWDV
jgi:hypothetical protein